jgi:flagellar biosynthesis protein FlhF
MDAVRASLGDEALVVHTATKGDGVEIVATTAAELTRFGSALRSPPARTQRGRRSQVIALVGPTGGGKSTTAAKLALSDTAFGGSRVGLISLDTYKIGAYEQIQTYADLGDLPLDILTEPAEVPAALERMARCDVILVDTPGRTPRATRSDTAWREALLALEPDEVHLVMPGGLRGHVADAFLEHYAELEPTHTLLTKLDEIPGEVGVAQLADRLALPARWITDGQLVPDDLHQAPDRLVASALNAPATGWALEAFA